MNARSFVSFAAGFPDDGEHPPDQEPVPAGRRIAEALAAALRMAYGSEPVVRQHSFYGWEFESGPYWCLLQCPDSWLLIVEDRSSVIKRWLNRRRTTAALAVFLGEIRRILETDARFSEIHWFSKSVGRG